MSCEDRDAPGEDDDGRDLPDPRTVHIRGVSEHGNFRIDIPCLSEIVPGLWLGGVRPGLLLPPEIVHLVSLYPWSRYIIRHELASEMYVAMADSTDQPMGMIPWLASWVSRCRQDGPVAVHCSAGLNRSALVSALALMSGGMSAAEAIALIRDRRDKACLCNPAFEAWLREQQ